jgi:squalene-associated FAD-dependent desaturase
VALAGDGARVLVLEARPGLGGRATAFTDRETGERVDNGQHVLIGCYHETFRFLKTIGADSLVALDDGLRVEIVDRQGERSRLTSARLPAPWHLLVGVLRWAALSWGDRASVLRLGRPLRQAVRRVAAGRPLDGLVGEETLEAWLVRHGQTPRIRELLWDPLAVAALNQAASVAAAEPFVRVLALMFGGTTRDSAIGVPRVPLDELYARPAARFVEGHGGEVRTGARAQIVCEGSRVRGVEVKGERLEADAVVCAVPWHAFGRTFDPMPGPLADTAARAAAMADSPIVTVNLWLDRPVTDVAFVGLPGRVMQWVFDKRQAFGEDTSHLSLVSSGASAVVGWSNQELVELATREIRESLPLARDASVLRATVVREKRATFSLAPGQPVRPPQATGVAGLVLAGDWTDTGLPATIEGAALSGHRAAALVKSLPRA